MAFGKSKPKLPMYQEMQDTPWISRNRELNTTTYNNLNRDLNNVNVFDDAIKQQLNAYNDSIYNRSVKDFDTDYANSMGKTLARDYNRFGTTGATTSLLSRDLANRTAQRKLADMEYNRAINYENMIDKELQRRYNWLNTNYGMFTNSGNTTENHDIANWKLRNQNLDRQYSNDVADYNSKNAIGKTLGTLGSVALGFTPLGPLGYTLGQTLTSGLFSDASNMLGVADGSVNLNTNGLYDALSYIGAKAGMPAWSQYWKDLKGDEVRPGTGNSGYNPFSASLGTYQPDYSMNDLYNAMTRRGLI